MLCDVTTQQLPEVEGTPRRARNPHMVPWIVVGLIVVVALVISTVIINVARGGDDDQGADPGPTATQEDGQTDSDGQDESEDDPDAPPRVDVGDTFTLDIQAWGVSAEVSSKFGQQVFYSFEGDNLILSSEVIDSLPEECAAMRSQWGATKVGDSYEVLKPETRCDAAPELYDEIWGLTAAFVDSIG